MPYQIALALEYHGAGFAGWQEQPGQRTIQAELKRVLTTVLRAPIRSLCASGRTDSGVHARQQIVSFFVDAPADLRALAYSVSCMLKDEVSVVHAAYMPREFHPLSAARRKEYRYSLLLRPTPPTLDRGRVWHLREALDITQMKHDAAVLEGTHDFKSLQGSKCAAKTSVRTIYSSAFVEEPPYLHYTVIGEGFLKQMVRNIVGTIVDRARGHLRESMAEVLAARDRRRAGVTAPAHGLTLMAVSYAQPFHDLLWRRNPEEPLYYFEESEQRQIEAGCAASNPDGDE